MLNIALNTFREIIRNKFFGLLAFLGVVFILLSLVLDTLALGETRRVLFDFGFSFIEITGLAIVLFMGGSMIAREIEGRTIYLMLSKPIRRGTIILGKFIGFSIAITLIVAIETLILLGILGIQGLFPDMLFLSAIVATWLKLELLLALIIFFSSWASPVMSMFMTISSYIIGHSGYTMLDFALLNQNETVQVLARTILAIFPNFTSLNIKLYVATDAIISFQSVFLALALAIVYLLCILYLSIYIFERKNFDSV